MSTGTSPENVNSEELVQIIREKVRQRKHAIAKPPSQAVPRRDSSELHHDVLDELTSITDEVSQQIPNIGQPTPTPPTIRGRFGRIVMAAIGRALWWYTYQLKAFAAIIQRLFQHQANAIGAAIREGADARADILELREEVQGVLIRLQQLEGSLSQHSDSAQRESRLFEDRWKRLDTQLIASTNDAEARRELLAAALERAEARLVLVEAQTQHFESLRTTLEALALRHDADMQSVSTILTRIEPETAVRLAAIEGQMSHLESLRSTLARARAELDQLLAAEVPRITNLVTRLSDLGLYTHHTRSQMTLLDRRFSLLIEEIRKHLPAADRERELSGFVAKNEHRHDSLYLAFQDVFRGTREEIKRRASVYLPMLKEQNVGSKTMPILDLGSGRGEWLELLRENGMECRGVDKNEAMLRLCRDLKLDVMDAEALPYLRSLPDDCLGGVTAFHMIEHIPFDCVIDLIDEALRTLRSGGILILETPNPGNVLVGSQNFYYDPTHIKPLPSGLMYFFVEARGFCNVEIKELQPFPESVRVPEDGQVLASRFNTYFYGAQDYAVIGRKP
jgi:O-antigen chain-terminating methyltransferase